MSAREELITKIKAELDYLSEEQMAELLRQAKWMIANSPQVYDPAKDPVVTDVLSSLGSPDAAGGEEILRDE